jgi:hypothetical protein
MAQRPSFDLTKVPTADKILAGGAFLLFIDSVLKWQTPCVNFQILGERCQGSVNAWGGSAAFAGILMALFALLLFIGEFLVVGGVTMPPNVSVPTVMAGLTAGTVLFGIIKVLFVLVNKPSYGAWLGLIIILAIAYGGYMKMQEAKAVSPPADTGFTA